MPNKELLYLYFPTNIQTIKQRRMGWVRHVARVGDCKGAYIVLMKKLRETDHLEDIGLDGRKIQK